MGSEVRCKINAQKGIATFNNLMVSTAGNYTLTVSSPGLTSITSTVFTIGPPVSTTNGTTILQSTPLSLNASPGGTSFNLHTTGKLCQWKASLPFSPISLTAKTQSNSSTMRSRLYRRRNGPAPVRYIHTIDCAFDNRSWELHDCRGASCLRLVIYLSLRDRA